jgi:hypothetical protein
VANFLLEALYFYNGFAFFDTLTDNMKMLATGRMIGYIDATNSPYSPISFVKSRKSSLIFSMNPSFAK